MSVGRGWIPVCLFGCSLVWGGTQLAWAQSAGAKALKKHNVSQAAAQPAAQRTEIGINEALLGVHYLDQPTPSNSGKWALPLTACAGEAASIPAWLKVSCAKRDIHLEGDPPATATVGQSTLKIDVLDANGVPYLYTAELTVKPSIVADYSRMQISLAGPYVEGASTLSGTVTNVPEGAAVTLKVETRAGPGANWMPAALSPAGAPVVTVAPGSTSGSFTIPFASPILGPLEVRITPTRIDTKMDLAEQQFLLPAFPAWIAFSATPRLRLDEPVLPGATVTGSLSAMPANAVKPVAAAGSLASPGNYPQIEVWVRGQDLPGWKLAELVPAGAGTAYSQPVDDGGRFSVSLKTPLSAGQEIRVQAVAPPGRTFQGVPAAVTPPDIAPPGSLTVTRRVLTRAALIQPTLSTSPLNEGTTVVAGNMTPSGGIAVSVAILRIKPRLVEAGAAPFEPVCMTADQLDRYVDVSNPSAQLLLKEQAGELLAQTTSTSGSLTGAVDATTGAFKVTLAQPLKEDEQIAVVQVLPAGMSVEPTQYAKCSSQPQRVTYPFEFHRTNLTFVAGVLISNSSATAGSANFSQANQFYSFNADHAWRLPGYDCVDGTEWAHAELGHCNAGRPGWHADKGVPGISTFFEARLTSIPVSTASSTPTTPGTGTSPAAAPTAQPTLLTSQKVFRVASGAYFPWVLTHGPGRHPNGLFFAPLVKAGFDTVAGANTVNNVVLPNQTIGSLTYQTAYNFFVFGGRLGNMSLSASHERAPLIEHYIDVTIGRYSNLQSFICKQTRAGMASNAFSQSSCVNEYPQFFTAGANSNVYESRKQLYRLDFEGLVKIPVPLSLIPFYIGFNANIAQHTVGAVALDHGYAPPDDIRIFFGTKIDLGTVLSQFKLGAN